MRLSPSILPALALALLAARSVGAENVAITIDQITPNQQISGYVRGLSPDDYRNHKVLVYVHTDQWYIHPFAGQDEGLSWAVIGKDGTWRLRTVQREFKADQVAALLVNRNYPEPNRLDDLRQIPHRAIVIKTLRGTPDFGKL